MTTWWAHEPTLRRFIGDLLAAELAQARPGRAAPPPPWPHGVDLVRDLGADSLDLLAMGSALAEALHLHQRGPAGGAHPGPADRLLALSALDDWIDAVRTGLRAQWAAPDGGAGSDADAGANAAVLTFRTSGSAGTPKRCTHLLATLAQETLALAQLLPGRRRILSAVPSHHIYGFLFTVLLPRLLGIEDVVDLRSATPDVLLRGARAGDLVVAHPGWWDALARLQPRFGADVAGVTSTAPCPDALADTLAEAGMRLLQVYGSSETAGVGWRERAGAPFTLFPYWSRVEGADALARPLPDGGMARYPLQDRLDWRDAEEEAGRAQGRGGAREQAGSTGRRFLPGGRIDQAVQVGGVNVFPGYVAEVLRMHPAVQDASVRLMRPDEGTRLKAFVVPRDGHLHATGDAAGDADGAKDAGGLGAELAAWIGARLPAPERPAAYTFGARLPRQASGKPGDWIIDAG
ncbi:AMP-binding protein [Massilia forsythiae]|uniref:AMP-binding protein n=1 Tax=Massilia forsythiae TaxID=2728020 RepID=A0A7Z2W0X9_9BURK|nr:AMP-binding protein [Massilia forsythiae]QJE02699.1 AMP-binding protein [Massilia forsythiae]